jgi:hypothetical protein
LQEQLIKLDAEQVQALQLEDFERAEKLNEKIEGTHAHSRTHARTLASLLDRALKVIV